MESQKVNSLRPNSLNNDLEDKTEPNIQNDTSELFTEQKAKPDRQSDDALQDDIIDKFLRGCYSLIPAVFSSAVIAGFLEIAAGWEITAGSVPMIGLTLLTFTGWYWLIKKYDHRSS